MLNEANYDKRIVERDGPPPGYDDYISSLRCCMCGSLESCNCVHVVPDLPKPKQTIKINSVCMPYIDWISNQIKLGTSAAAIHRGLMRRFGFRNGITSVEVFVRKLKGIQYNS